MPGAGAPPNNPFEKSGTPSALLRRMELLRLPAVMSATVSMEEAKRITLVLADDLGFSDLGCYFYNIILVLEIFGL